MKSIRAITTSYYMVFFLLLLRDFITLKLRDFPTKSKCIVLVLMFVVATVPSSIAQKNKHSKPRKTPTPLLGQPSETVRQNEPAVIQWVSRVVSYSSSYNEKGPYSAWQLLGKPNLRSYSGGLNPCAWAGRYEEKENTREYSNRVETIRVGFEQPIFATQVAIVEAYNPGTVSKVVGYGENGESKTLYSTVPAPVGSEGRILNIFFEPPPFKIAEVGIWLHTGQIPDWNLIDAIAISSGLDSIKAEINLAPYSSEIKVKKLGSEINSPDNELAPVISPDGKTLYFSRTGRSGSNSSESSDVWYADVQHDGKVFNEAKNIGDPLNDIYPNFICSITPDGTTMLLGNEYIEYGAPKGGTSISIRNADGGWGFPEAQTIQNYYNRNTYGHYCLSSDRKSLLLCLKRDEGEGNQDVYVSFVQSDSTWSTPMNLGRTINTAGDESTVFLAPDTRTLFFSSSGHNGYGGNDIFVSTRLDASWKYWSEPMNLGDKVNSKGGNAYYTVDASGKNAYCVSSQLNGNSDIYHIELPPSLQVVPVVLVEGKVYNSNSKTPVLAKIYYENLLTGKEVGVAQTNPQTGEYKIVLPAGTTYGFRAESKGTIPVSEHIDLRTLGEFRVLRYDLSLVPDEVGQTILLNNLFFAYNQSEIERESIPELVRLGQELLRSPNMKILITGHTDNTGSDGYNLRLSRKRADEVAKFIEQEGIPRSQIQTQGKGKAAPVVSNETDEGRKKNRRVEFTILEK
ncbi:MAG: OmpA family protein [Ignavibacteria bacterium]|nr:OmpA family protein [Ignavibacteria bacterium]